MYILYIPAHMHAYMHAGGMPFNITRISLTHYILTSWKKAFLRNEINVGCPIFVSALQHFSWEDTSSILLDLACKMFKRVIKYIPSLHDVCMYVWWLKCDDWLSSTYLLCKMYVCMYVCMMAQMWWLVEGHLWRGNDYHPINIRGYEQTLLKWDSRHLSS